MCEVVAMMTLDQILQIEGIVVRKIPMQTISTYRIGHLKSHQLLEIPKENTIEENGVLLQRIVKDNVYGGKYFVQINANQYSTVIFNRKTSGIGDTVEEAYSDYLSKNGMLK